MKQIVFTDPDPDRGLVVLGPVYHDRLERKRKPQYESLKRTNDGWAVLDFSEVAGTLLATDDDVTLIDGTSLYQDSPDRYLQYAIERDQEALILTSTGQLRPVLPANIPYHIVEWDNIPADHPCDLGCEFRNAWEWTTKLVVNMPKARLIHMAQIRVARNKALENLDAPWMIALEAGDQVAAAEIAAQKQVLRDIPQTFDLTTDTPEELKEKWPEGLPKDN